MSEPVTFESLNLSPAILKAVEELGYKTPSEIQAQCIPLLLERKDVLVLTLIRLNEFKEARII